MMSKYVMSKFISRLLMFSVLFFPMILMKVPFVWALTTGVIAAWISGDTFSKIGKRDKNA